jgi:hypothetical protein
MRERLEQRMRELAAAGDLEAHSRLVPLWRLYRLLDGEETGDVPVPLEVIGAIPNGGSMPRGLLARLEGDEQVRFVEGGRATAMCIFSGGLRNALDRAAANLLGPPPIEVSGEPALYSGTLTVEVEGQRVEVPIAAGDTPAQVAANVQAATGLAAVATPSAEPSQDILRRAVERVIGSVSPAALLSAEPNPDRPRTEVLVGLGCRDEGAMAACNGTSIGDSFWLWSPSGNPATNTAIIIRRTTWESALAAVQGEPARSVLPTIRFASPTDLRAQVAALLEVDLSDLAVTSTDEDYAAETVRISGIAAPATYLALVEARTRAVGQRIRRLEPMSGAGDVVSFEMTVYVGRLQGEPSTLDLTQRALAGDTSAAAALGERAAQRPDPLRTGLPLSPADRAIIITDSNITLTNREGRPLRVSANTDVSTPYSASGSISFTADHVPTPRHAGVAATQADQAARASAPMKPAPEEPSRFTLLEIDPDQPGEAEERARYIAEEAERAARRRQPLPKWTPVVREPAPPADRFALLEPREEPLPVEHMPPLRREAPAICASVEAPPHPLMAIIVEAIANAGTVPGEDEAHQPMFLLPVPRSN